MLLHISNAKWSPLVLSLLVLLVNINVLAQNATRQRNVEATARSTVRLAVLPFRNALVHQTSGDAQEITSLGEGLADSVTNALKTLPGVTVIDSEIVLRAAARFPGTEVSVKDEDAMQVAESLSAQIIVVGSFQLIRDHLHVDARLLTVGTNRPASKLVADGKYPDEYSVMVTQLITAILPSLKIPLAQLKTAAAQSELTGVHSRETLKWYNNGIQQSHIGTEGSLENAIDSFAKALAIEPDFAQALAEKSKAERRLYAIRKDPNLVQAARNDASGSVARSPNLGRGHGALAGAERAAGDPTRARQSEMNARSMSPGDIGSIVDFTKAQDTDGKLVRSAYTDKLFAANPELSLVFPQLPKVLVKNNSDYAITVTVTPDGGQAYPTIKIPPNSSRIMAVFPGHCRLVVVSELGRVEDLVEYQEGVDHDYEVSGTSFPVGTFVFVNEGNCDVKVRIAGVRNKSLVLEAGEKTSVTFPPGSYSVTARLQTAMKSSEHELRVGQDEIITYQTSCGRYAVFDPASLLIKNDGNAPFRATLTGPTRYSTTVPVGGTRVTLPAGSYHVRLTCGNAVREEETELRGEAETVIEGRCQIYRRYIYR
jgi:TolB-like protein